MRKYFTQKRLDLLTEESYIHLMGEWTPAIGKLFRAAIWFCDLMGAES